MTTLPIILTGDRPTGPLHLGHLVGSLQNRVRLQSETRQFILIADLQALTDHARDPQLIRNSIREVLLDYLAVGIDPIKTRICVQSALPELAELGQYFLNLVSLARLERNPTVKAEIQQKGFGRQVPVGFFTYPISQAADILAFQADLVPVGEDQLPMIELCNEIGKRFNQYYGKLFEKVQPIMSQQGRLPGIDGANKMGKSLGNAIFLKDEPEVVRKKVMKMYTDPNHLRVSDPGKVEGNPVFTYLDAFGKDKRQIEAYKAHYRRGGLGDVVVKNYLLEVLEEGLQPIRKKRQILNEEQAYLNAILEEGNQAARAITRQTLKQVRAQMGLQRALVG